MTQDQRAATVRAYERARDNAERARQQGDRLGATVAAADAARLLRALTESAAR